jgi:hypothetical protein
VASSALRWEGPVCDMLEPQCVAFRTLQSSFATDSARLRTAVTYRSSVHLPSGSCFTLTLRLIEAEEPQVSPVVGRIVLRHYLVVHSVIRLHLDHHP